MSKRSAILIYNPRSGAHRRRDRQAELDTFVRRASEHGVETELQPTTGPGSAAGIARAAVESGVDIVVGNGGDGTLNEVLQGMVGSETPLVVWGGGTANVLSRELELPTDPIGVADLIGRGIPQGISVGRAGERYFFLMAGIGLDASIVREVSPELKARVGEGAFWVSGIKHYVSWKPEPFDLSIDGQVYSGAFAAVGNAANYGGNFRVTPRARLQEPTLDVCIFPTRRFAFSYTKDLVACMTGDPTRFGDVTYVKTQAVVATGSAENRPWVQVDGEVLGQLPMEFAAVPNALTVLVPRT